MLEVILYSLLFFGCCLGAIWLGFRDNENKDTRHEPLKDSKLNHSSTTRSDYKITSRPTNESRSSSSSSSSSSSRTDRNNDYNNYNYYSDDSSSSHHSSSSSSSSSSSD